MQSDVVWWETGLMGTGWNNAEWIGANTDSDTGYQNLTTFTIEADYEIKDTAFSLIFGAQDENNFYMQQINASVFRNKDNGLCTVRPHKWTNGQGACLETKRIDASVYSDRANALGTTKHLKIEVTDGNIKTFIDDVLVDDRTVAPFKLGKVGFRTARNDRSDVNEHEQFYVDNLIVKDANGAVVFSDEFDDLTNFPGAGTISSGRLYMTYDKLVLQSNQTTQKAAPTLSPITVSEPEEHVFVYDFGQNFAGTVRLRVKGTAGTKIRLRYAEMLNDGPKGTRGNDGNADTVYQANLRSAKNTDYYVLRATRPGKRLNCLWFIMASAIWRSPESTRRCRFRTCRAWC